MVLVDHELREMVRSQHIKFEGFDEACLEPATYDMRVGKHVFAVSSEGPERIDLSERRILIIGASELAIVGSYEALEMPRDVVGHMGLKSSLSRRGLYASTGPQIDPGFRGRLFISLFNLTPSPIPLNYMETFLTVEFQRLPNPPERGYEGPNQGKYELTADDIEPLLNYQAPSLGKIHKEFGEMAENLRTVAGFTRKFDEFLASYKLERENLLRTNTSLIGEIRKLVRFIVEDGARGQTITLRDISRKQARKEILDLFKSGETLYYSDIAERLRLDLKMVVDICNELEKQGQIGVLREKKSA